METKPTPGPWEWVGRDLEQKGGEYKTVIGSEVSCGAYCYGGSVDMCISDADARLIAAAPDLLEALKWYVENDDTNIGMEGNEFWEEGLERGKAALAKATGEA